MSTTESTVDAVRSVWEVPPGVEERAGWRHLFALLGTVAVGTIVAGLGTLSFASDDIPAGFSPAAAVQAVAGIWFGAWGVIAGVLFPAITRSLLGPANLPVRVIVDLILSGLPALWFRYSRRDPRLRTRRDRIMYLVVVVGVTNLLAALTGTTYWMLADAADWGWLRWAKGVLAWFASGAGPCLVLGFPLLKTLSPVITRSSLFCRGWWRSPVNFGPSLRRFRHQPILVKILLGLTGAGFLPLLIVLTIGLWDDYRQAQRRALDVQESLAAQIEMDLEQLLASHAEIVAREPAPDNSAALSDSREQRVLFSPVFPNVLAELQFVPIEALQEAEGIENEQVDELARGGIVTVTGPGPRPKRRDSVNMMRLIGSGTVLINSIDVADVEQVVFGPARRRGQEYGLFLADGERVLSSAGFRRPEASTEGSFIENADGRRLCSRRILPRTGWVLELMIPQASAIQAAFARRRDATAVIALLALFAALIVGGYLARALEEPIRDLTRTVRDAGRLDVEVEAAVHGRDEIGELAVSFNEMSRQLRRSISALERTTAEKERLKYEFELAAHLQRRILPVRPPAVPGFDIAGLCEPAREVGGDFFDWHVLSEIRIGLLIGDACGKGMGAAFLMNEARSIAVAHLSDIPSAGAVLRRTNHTLYQARTIDDVFTTMFCLILTVPSGRLEFASAGHPPPILYRPGSDVLAELDTTGRPLGLDPDNPIESGEVVLGAGDVVVAFTDGVLDAVDADGTPFGRARLERVVRDNHQCCAVDLAHKIERAVQAHCEPSARFDDLTVLVIRSLPSEPAAAVPS